MEVVDTGVWSQGNVLETKSSDHSWVNVNTEEKRIKKQTPGPRNVGFPKGEENTAMRMEKQWPFNAGRKPEVFSQSRAGSVSKTRKLAAGQKRGQLTGPGFAIGFRRVDLIGDIDRFNRAVVGLVEPKCRSSRESKRTRIRNSKQRQHF